MCECMYIFLGRESIVFITFLTCCVTQEGSGFSFSHRLPAMLLRFPVTPSYADKRRASFSGLT